MRRSVTAGAAGIVAVAAYVATTAVGGWVDRGISDVANSISELTSSRAPNRGVLAVGYLAYNLALVVMVVALWRRSAATRSTRAGLVRLLVTAVAGSDARALRAGLRGHGGDHGGRVAHRDGCGRGARSARRVLAAGARMAFGREVVRAGDVLALGRARAAADRTAGVRDGCDQQPVLRLVRAVCRGGVPGLVPRRRGAGSASDTASSGAPSPISPALAARTT